jgi:hypothetical protein
VIPRKVEKSKTRRFRGKRGKKRSEYLNKDERENETPFSLKAFLTGSLSTTTVLLPPQGSLHEDPEQGILLLSITMQMRGALAME